MLDSSAHCNINELNITAPLPNGTLDRLIKVVPTNERTWTVDLPFFSADVGDVVIIGTCTLQDSIPLGKKRINITTDFSWSSESSELLLNDNVVA